MMATDWKPGDVAERIEDWWPAGVRAPDECSPILAWLAPSIGSRWIVDRVHMIWRNEEGGGYFPYLSLAGQSEDILHAAELYRKVLDAPAEDEIALLLNTPIDAENAHARG